MKVSVLISVYNTERYICECLNSVLNQTFEDFEILIVDDGSTDHTVKIIKCFSDPRIRLIEKNHDFIESLNVGLRECQGEYIARMDADDTMEPSRLQKQVEVMDRLSDVVVCGSWMRCFGLQNSEVKNFEGFLIEPLVYLLLGNIVANPSTMLRKSFLQKHNIQYKNYLYAEDYYFWVDIAKRKGQFWIIPECLTYYRCSYTQVSYVYMKEQNLISEDIKSQILLMLLDFENYSTDLYRRLYEDIQNLNELGLLSSEIIYKLFFDVFMHDYYKNHKI